MATSANSYLRVTELDFEDIRTNLKSFLSTQTQFQDYNFEGSAISTLLDVLAYNTHYNSYYINMLANEMFLDTAQQRESVVSKAKELGYVPVSAIGASANINLVFTGVDNSTSQFTIPKNSKFTTTIDDVQYTYVTPEAYTVVNANNTFSKDVTIKEGIPLTHRFTVSDSKAQRFVIPNAGVDMTSLTVFVQESETDTTEVEFTQATDIKQVYATTPVYFLEEAYEGKYELVFGSGSLGKALKNGNIVKVSYLVCNGDDTNGASTFSVDTLNVGVDYTKATLTVNKNAAGGRPKETIESIKFNAPRNYQTQNRAVISDDYSRIILSENPDIESVTSYGGQDATPAQYGKVIIAVKPFAEKFVTQTRKNQLKQTIQDRTPLAVDPLFVDADYTYIIPEIKTYYNMTKTTDTTSAIKQSVLDAIETFSTNNLERFGNRLRYSKFVRALDNINTGVILNNEATIKIEKRITPNTNKKEKVIVNFSNPLRKSTLNSTQFTFQGFACFLDDDGNGKVRIYRFNDQKQKTIVLDSVGTINYTTGNIEISNFAPTAYVGIEMKISGTPDRLDVIPVREQILIMEKDEASVTLIGEAI